MLNNILLIIRLRCAIVVTNIKTNTLWAIYLHEIANFYRNKIYLGNETADMKTY
jgi:hypothetical protein